MAGEFVGGITCTLTDVVEIASTFKSTGAKFDNVGFMLTKFVGLRFVKKSNNNNVTPDFCSPGP